MRKSDKKTDNQLRIMLTDVCETALKSIEGFAWLTHKINYDDFPASLKIICVFDCERSLKTYLDSHNNEALKILVNAGLKRLDIKIKQIAQHIIYDSEEACTLEHNGNWARRLA